MKSLFICAKNEAIASDLETVCLPSPDILPALLTKILCFFLLALLYIFILH